MIVLGPTGARSLAALSEFLARISSSLSPFLGLPFFFLRVGASPDVSIFSIISGVTLI